MQGKERGLFLSREGCEGKARWLCRLFGQRKKLCLVLLCVLMNHALREGPTRDLGVSRAGRSLPGLRESPALRRDAPGDAETPRDAGTEQAGHGSVAVLQGTRVIPSDCPFSRAGSFRAPPSPSPALPAPAQGCGTGWPCRGWLSPSCPSLTPAPCPYGLRAPLSEGALGSVPAANRAGPAASGFKGRRGCGARGRLQPGPLLAWTHALNCTHVTGFGPVPACPRAARAPRSLLGAVRISGRSWCSSAAPPAFPPSLFRGSSPNAPITHTQRPECSE